MASAQEVVKWVLQVVDVVSAPVRTSVAALVGLDNKLQQSKKVLNQFEEALHAINIGMKAVAAVGGTMSKVFSGVGGAVTSIAGGLFKAGQMIKDMLVDVGELALGKVAYREDTIVGMRAMFGDMVNAGEMANELFDHAMKVALKTKFETQDVVDIYNTLLTGGFKTGQLDTITAAVADVSTARGKARGDRFTNALIKMNAMGRTTWGTLAQAGIAGAGIPVKEIAEMLGLDSKKSAAELTKEIQKRAREGIDSSVGIKALLQKVQQLYDPGGKLGDFAVAQSATLSGIYSNFKEAVTNLFMSKEFGDLPALKTLKTSLLTITALFDPSKAGSAGDNAKRFMGLLDQIATDILGVFDISPSSANTLFETLIKAGETVEQYVIRPVTNWLKNDLGPGFVKALATINQIGLGAALSNALKDVGRILGLGIAEGMKEAMIAVAKSPFTGGSIWNTLYKKARGQDTGMDWSSGWFRRSFEQSGAVEKQGKSLANDTTDLGYMSLPMRGQSTGANVGKGLESGIEQGMNNALQIRSPSKVAEKIGERGGNMTGAGLANGLAKGGMLNGGGAVPSIVVHGNLTIVVGSPDSGDADADASTALGQALYQLVARSSRTPGADRLAQPMGRAR